MFDFASYHRAATLADAINLLADNPQPNCSPVALTY
ncbi:xanthine dehydrogenase FAD-binding subunit [Escherichia coli]|nr:xanthine dehydrogenase FAD-binding subunit [Escherichia coli]